MTEPSRDLVRLGDLPDETPRTPGILALHGAIMKLDDERRQLAEIGDSDSLVRGGSAVESITDALYTVLRQTRLDVATILDGRERARRDGERARRLAEGDDPDSLPRFLRPDASLGPVRAEVDGVGAVEVHGGWTRKNWESMRLLDRMLRVALDGFELWSADGEDQHEAVYARLTEVLGSVMPLHPSLQWKVGRWPTSTQPATGLKSFGIDDGEFCDRVEKPRMASWPKRRESK